MGFVEDLPDNAAERKFIVVVDRVKFDRAVNGLDDARPQARRLDTAFLNASAAITPPSRITKMLSEQNLLFEGNVLVQSPFDQNHYALFAEAERTFAVEKFMGITEVCRLLGATQVTISSVERVERKRGWGARIGVFVPQKADANAETKRTTATDLERQLKVIANFDGGEPLIEAAQARLEAMHLSADAELQSLIDGRSGDGLHLKSREVYTNLSEETNRLLTIGLGIDIEGFGKLPGGFDLSDQRSSRYEVRFEVKFGD